MLNKNKDHDTTIQLENIFIEISAFSALQNMSNEEKSIITDGLMMLAINGKNS